MSHSSKWLIVFYIFLATFLSANTDAATSVTINGITWTFSSDYTVGSYIDGSPWVLAPSGISITSITPTWDGTGNGCMKNPVPDGERQGYHASMTGYDAAVNACATYPINLSPGDVLISTIDWDQPYGTSTWDPILGGNASQKTYVSDASILTVVGTIPASDSFRPGYCDTTVQKRLSDADLSVFRNLTPAASQPSIATLNGIFEQGRPWIDHVVGWAGAGTHPLNNMPSYGGYLALYIGFAATALNSNYGATSKETAQIGLLQYGIDLYSILTAGSYGWLNDGGHATGRKLPLLIAATVFNDAGMKAKISKSGDYLYSGGHGPADAPSDYVHFGEDDQTFYVAQSDVDITNSAAWAPDSRNTYGNYPYTSAMIGMPEWGIRHADAPQMSDSSWRSYYRECCTIFYAKGLVLSAYIMGFANSENWNHRALFDYMDRFFAISTGQSDPFGYVVEDEGAGYNMGGFVGNMWLAYRANYAYASAPSHVGRWRNFRFVPAE